MLLLISPAKSLNFNLDTSGIKSTTPSFLSDSKYLVSVLKKFSISDLIALMKISKNLASLNYQRFQDFHIPFSDKNSKPAIFVFDGDVYEKIIVESYSKEDFSFATSHLRILSGLYGILRPLDLIQPYRLEMKTILANICGKNLYQFWQEKITNYLNLELAKFDEKIILNLASKEYFDAVDSDKINGKIINIIFKEKKGSDYKIVGIFAKKARGAMVDFIIRNKLKNAEAIKKITVEGYKFFPQFSDDFNWCFCR